MDIDEIGQIAEALDGVRRRGPRGGTEWRYRGRLVVRQIDDDHVVIWSDFGERDELVARSGHLQHAESLRQAHDDRRRPHCG